MVTLSCYHSTNHTPSVRPFGLPAPPSGSRGIVRIRLGFHRTVGAYRETPQSALTGCQLPFQGRFWGAYPTSPERGGGPRVSVAEGFAVRRIPIRKCQGEFVQSKTNMLRIRPWFHKTAGAYCETPLRLAKSRLAAVARLHGACGRTSQPLRAASN